MRTFEKLSTILNIPVLWYLNSCAVKIESYASKPLIVYKKAYCFILNDLAAVVSYSLGQIDFGFQIGFLKQF